YGSADKRGGFGAVNVFEHFGIDALAFGFEVGDLSANHTVDRACGAGDFCKHGDAAGGVDGSGGDRLECEREQRVAGEDGGGFAELFVGGGFAAAEVVVVEGGQVV